MAFFQCNIFSESLGMMTNVNIVMPQFTQGMIGWTEKDTGTRPVLYLLHGGGGDEDAWSTLGRTCQILDNLIAAGKAEPMLVVMPNGNPSQYASQTLGIPENQNVKKYNSGFDNYTSLVNDIVPFIESRYNVIAKKSGRLGTSDEVVDR